MPLDIKAMQVAVAISGLCTDFLLWWYPRLCAIFVVCWQAVLDPCWHQAGTTVSFAAWLDSICVCQTVSQWYCSCSYSPDIDTGQYQAAIDSSPIARQ